MLIKNDISYFYVSIKNYEYPDMIRKEGDDPFDANWLFIEIKYFNGIKEYSYCDCCFLTFEWNEIINELEKIKQGKSVEYISDFLEPYLEIEVKNNGELYMISLTFITDTVSKPWKKLI